MALFERRLAFVVCCALAPVMSSAQEDGVPSRAFGLWVGHVGSDNIARIPNGERGSYDSVGVLLNAKRDAARLQAAIDTNIEFRQYSLDELSDERVGTLNGSLGIDIVPDVFAWTFSDSYGQGQTDPFRAVGPENRESINVASSGPQLDFSLGDRMKLSLDGKYTRRTYQRSESLDSDTAESELGLYRRTSSTASIGLVATHSTVEYDADVEPYDIDGMLLRYERELASGSVLGEIGRNKISLADTEDSGPQFELGWDRAVGRRSRIKTSITREFTDSGTRFGLTASQVLALQPTDVFLSSSPMEEKRFDVLYDFRSMKTAVTIGMASFEDDFVDDILFDNDSDRVRATFDRTLTRKWSVGVMWESVERSYSNIDRKDRDKSSSASVSYRLARRILLDVLTGVYSRTGTDELRERRYELRVRYDSTL